MAEISIVHNVLRLDNISLFTPVESVVLFFCYFEMFLQWKYIIAFIRNNRFENILTEKCQSMN